jgi:hypothetical protein
MTTHTTGKYTDHDLVIDVPCRMGWSKGNSLAVIIIKDFFPDLLCILGVKRRDV